MKLLKQIFIFGGTVSLIFLLSCEEETVTVTEEVIVTDTVTVTETDTLHKILYSNRYRYCLNWICCSGNISLHS